MPKPQKKRRLWEIDPSIFQPGRKATLPERVAQPFKDIAKYLIFALAMAYPLGLVTVGLVYGGVVFWATFFASIAAIGIIITKAGYARNFQHWDISLRKMGGLVVAFFMALGFYLGLIYLKTWMIPVVALIMGLGLILIMRKPKI